MKRLLMLALCLLLIPAASAEIYVVDYTLAEQEMGYSLLLTEDGVPLVPRGAYSRVYAITPEETPEAERLYSAASGDVMIEYDAENAEEWLYATNYERVALLDARGERLTGFDYLYLEYANGYVIFALPDADMPRGAMDAEGNVVIEPEYAALQPLGEGRWLAMARREDGAEPSGRENDDYYDYHYALQLIDADGSVRDLGLHSSDCYFNVNPEGICTLWNVDEYGDGGVFIDSKGEVMFGMSYVSLENFKGDYAVVDAGGGIGVIDKTGEFVVPGKYDYIEHYEGKGYVAVRGSQAAVFAEADCAPMFEVDFAPAEFVSLTAISSELFLFSVDGRQSVYSADGTLVMEVPEDRELQTYNQPEGPVERLIVCGEQPETWSCLIDMQGNAVSGMHRYLNVAGRRDGETRYITVDFECRTDSDGEAMPVWESYRYGLIDEDGQTLLPEKYDELRALSFDRFWVTLGDRCGLIDAAGHWYYSISDYEELVD